VKKTNWSRREFLGTSAVAAGASLAANTLPNLLPDPKTVAASDRVRFGMIGVGMQGHWLLSEAAGCGVRGRLRPLRWPAHVG